MANNTFWAREQSLIAFRLYCCIPFGRLHRTNPEIIQLAKQIGRTPGAMAMKACNFASLDPAQQARGIKGLPNVSKMDRQIWEEFRENSEQIAAEIEEAYHRATEGAEENFSEKEIVLPERATESIRSVRVRNVQSFFRAAIVAAYDGMCAITGIAVPELLTASHIIPWSISEQRRADPTNGICLNALHDRAFDRGLLTIDEKWNIVVATSMRDSSAAEFQQHSFAKIHGQPLRFPAYFYPDPQAMAYHREHIFVG